MPVGLAVVYVGVGSMKWWVPLPAFVNGIAAPNSVSDSLKLSAVVLTM